MARIDAVENKIKKTELATLTEEEKTSLFAMREAAMNYMKQLLQENEVRVELGEFDKYGRILSEVFLSNGQNVSDDLIQRGLVFCYGGETKLSLKEQAAFAMKRQ